MKKATLLLFAVLVFCAVSFLIHLYFIGEVVDGRQFHYTISEHDDRLTLTIQAPKDQIYRHWNQRRKGTVLSITARKTQPLPLQSPSQTSLEIQLAGLTEITLGGRTIWRKLP